MIERETRGDVAIVRVARGKGNSVNLDLLLALIAEFDRLEAGPAKAVVLTGEGRSFSAGVDLTAVLEGGASYLEKFLPALVQHFGALVSFPKPVVAAVNGHAIAGGCIATLACDYRIMARGSGRIGLTELLVGVPFPSMALEIARFFLPAEHLSAVVYTGATYDPDEALRRGFVDELADPDRLLDRACEMATQFAQVPASSFATVKRMLRKPLVEAAARGHAEDDPAVAAAWESPEVRKRMADYVAATLRRK